METKRERDARKADAKAQEKGPPLPKVARYARGWVHTKHPETGLDVVFKDGEMIPDWAPETDPDEDSDA